jgi:choline-glycine betaine transporter
VELVNIKANKGRTGSVFYLSVWIITLFVLWGIIRPESMAAIMQQLLDFIIRTFGWFYLLTTITFVVFSVWLGFGRYGRIKLGNDEDEPEYSFYTWLAMLFSAGMGIGLVFWGIAEPVTHYTAPPEGVIPETAEAAQIALRYSFYVRMPELVTIFLLVTSGGGSSIGIQLHVPGAVTALSQFLLQGTAFDLPWLYQSFPL